jgi:hypothetical protein
MLEMKRIWYVGNTCWYHLLWIRSRYVNPVLRCLTLYCPTLRRSAPSLFGSYYYIYIYIYIYNNCIWWTIYTSRSSDMITMLIYFHSIANSQIFANLQKTIFNSTNTFQITPNTKFHDKSNGFQRIFFSKKR